MEDDDVGGGGIGVDDWVREAMRNDEISAAVLISLRDAAPPRHRRRCSSPSPPWILKWGIRRLRRHTRGGFAGGGGEKADAEGRRTESPTTPMEFSSGASASGLDDRSGASAAVFSIGTKEVSGERQDPAAAAKPIRRLGKRKAISELLDMEMSMQGDRRALRRELEALMERRDALRARNLRLQTLKLELQSEEARAAPTDPESRGRDSFFLLPDLNEPAATEFFVA